MWPLRWLLIFLPFCLGTLNDFLGLPYAIRYVLDLAWILQLFLFLCYRKRFATLRVGKLAQWAMLFFITTLAVFPVQYQSALYYLWGLRNNFRFYATFVGLAAFLKADEIEDSCSIDVHVEAYLYGEGETVTATPEEVVCLMMRLDWDPAFLANRCDNIGDRDFVIDWDGDEVFGYQCL